MKELNIPRINETIYQETLPNGLTVFYYPKEDFEKRSLFSRPITGQSIKNSRH